MDSTIEAIRALAASWAAQRSERQRRRHLDPADFAGLHQAGFARLAVPRAHGGAWVDVPTTVPAICHCLRLLGAADSSVALVAAMHPSVLSFWLTLLAQPNSSAEWRAQCEQVFGAAHAGEFWGTITSEPGSGGDIHRTRAQARRDGQRHALHGQKHFGSGSGVTSFMVTTAIPEGEEAPDWFFLDVRGARWDGENGVKLVAEWDGHGMAATQSHGFAFDGYPATRIAWPGQLTEIQRMTGPMIGCFFTAVILGVVDAAMRAGANKLAAARAAYEQTEWVRANQERWLCDQAFAGMLRATSEQADGRLDVLRGKTAIAELAESLLARLSRAIGGATYSRHSPFGFWFEDVRALGFLRPPWPLAYQTLLDGCTTPSSSSV